MSKKEIPQKNTFYGNFEMQQRRETSDPFSLPPNLTNVQVTPPPSNSNTIHNSYAAAQMLLKQNPTTAKNRFGNSNAQDAYYNSAYLSKQSNPSAEYYGKYEVEFAAHQQKIPLINNQMLPFNQQTKVEFNDTKPTTTDFHHAIKGEIHHNVKPEHLQSTLQIQNQQAHHKNPEFQYGKPPNVHLSHQNFYNHHAAHNANVDGAHQIPMQYSSNQYFPNEYSNANEIDFYEQKTPSTQAAANYYENMYNNSNNSGAEFNNSIDNVYPTPSNGQLPNEQCNEFAYPQYFDGNHHHHPNNTSISIQTPQVHQQNHIAHVHNPLNPSQQFSIGNGPAYHVTQQLNGSAHIANSPMDNSNSSSDFNFLSNLANDFAPEYYQLS